MPKPWRLTRQAEHSLVEIARWTLETFGLRQAEAYETDLIARCAAIAAGEAPLQDCRRLIDPNLPEDLRVTRAGQHFIVFVDMPDQVIVVDVLHSRSDLPRRLAALGSPKGPDQL
ncbi:MAG: type II toxin-antitoxin system RelE/ParE family toxin [Alphaproteobacteria bacterium]